MTARKQASLFPQGDDLPLFSGTPQRVVVAQPFTGEAGEQQRMYDCPICFGTGYVLLDGRARKCTYANHKQEV